MSAPAQQQPRFSGVRRAAVGVVSGSAVVGALTMANAPWEAVVLTVLGTLVVSLVLGLAQIVMPEKSDHKRDLLLAWIRHRDRRAKVHEGRRDAPGGRDPDGERRPQAVAHHQARVAPFANSYGAAQQPGRITSDR